MNTVTAEGRGGLSRWAPWIVRLVGAWILTGALFKLLAGTPNDLPRVVVDVGKSLSFSVGGTYRTVIAIELALFSLAALRPRWAWPVLTGVLLLFDAILIQQMGSESCGCFGSKITMPPWVMMSIDSALLVVMLVGRPWRAKRGGPPLVLLPVALAISLALPWLLDREAAAPVPAAAGGGGSEALRPFVVLDVEDWAGKDLGETPLADYLPVYDYFPDALWVLYRTTCEHCAEHLRHLADTEKGERFLVLLRLREPQDTEANRIVGRMPSGGFVQHAELPESVDWVLQTPGELVVEAFRVVSGAEGVESDG